MDQFNKTVCDHIGKGLTLAPSVIEIAGSTFAVFVLTFCWHFA